jgi:ribosomal RNA-processing protein 36
MPKAKKPTKRRDESTADDRDSLEPYSDELDVSSPELMITGDDGVQEELEWEDAPEFAESEDADGDGDERSVSEHSEQVDDEEVDSGESEIDPEEAVQRKLNTVSFETLVRAQDSLGARKGAGAKRKRAERDDDAEGKLDKLRARLRELQREKGTGLSSAKSQSDVERKAAPNRRVNTQDELDVSQEESDASDHPPSKKARSSKHAPAVMSSKRAVTRRRAVVPVPKSTARDPRFDELAGPLDREKMRRNYSFLDEYVESEIKELKTVLNAQPGAPGSKQRKKNKNKGTAAAAATKRAGVRTLAPEETAALKQELVRKESRRAAQEAADRRRQVVQEHKRKEKELVKQGKKPFYLKEKEVKKQVLVQRFEGMGEGKRAKVMEKKRKRVKGKEARGMPWERRS